MSELVEGADETELARTIARHGRADLLLLDEFLSQEFDAYWSADEFEGGGDVVVRFFGSS